MRIVPRYGVIIKTRLKAGFDFWIALVTQATAQ